MGYSGLLVILLIAIDQFTKWLAYTHLYQKPDVSVIDGVFQLKYLENDSAAFSLDPVSILHRIFHFTYFDSHPEAFLMAKMNFFAVLTIVVLVLLAIVYQRIPLNRRFLPLNIIAVGIFAMIHNGIYQCPGIMSCRWMNDHPFGFVHNQNIIVFIQNVQRNVFRFNGRFDSIRNGDTYEIFCMYWITGLLNCPVYLNLFVFDKFLKKRTGEIRINFGKNFIQTLPFLCILYFK